MSLTRRCNVSPLLARRRWIAIAFTSLLCIASAGAHGAEFKERTLRFAYVQPKDSHMGFGVERFAARVAEKSKGRITVSGFGNGTLGSDQQTLSALQGGTLDMTTMPPGVLVGLDKLFSAFSLHFLFSDYKEADTVLDGPVGKKFMDRVPAGLVGLAYWDHGFRNFSNSKRPVSRVEDLHGLKLRAPQESLFIESFKALGINPLPLAFPELYSAMETRAVDGQDNPVAAFEANKFHEVQKYVSSTRHVYQPLIVLISKKTWDRLTPDERSLLREAARETAIEQRQASRAMEAKAIAAIQKAGTVFTELSPAERARMRERVRPVSEDYLKKMAESDPLPGELVRAVEAARGNQ